MKANLVTTPLHDLLDLIPNEFSDPGVRQRLRKLAQNLDELMIFDDNIQQVSVDRRIAQQVLRENFPAELHDRVQRELESHLQDKLKDRGKDRILHWREVPGHGIPFDPVAAAELRGLGIDASSSSKDVRRILHEHYPEIPESLLNADAAQLHEMIIRALRHNRTVWDCCVAHLGLWATMAVFAVAGAFLIVGTATGPWGIPLAIWLIGVLGGGTAMIVLNCVMNPEWVGP